MPALDPFIGKQIDDFTITERIGYGGMATVYSAHQPSVNRSVALKIIRLDNTQGERDEFRRRFAQEANLIASLEHIHILPIYDYGIVDDEIAYIAMRLLRGGTLANFLTAEPEGWDRAVDIFLQICNALHYAHSKGVIHRDLKPSNILLDDTGNAYLTDFGLAKLVENSVDLTKTGNIVGTPVYMSPEQLRGEPIDHRSDIYSMGVILYHIFVGRPPFEASDTNVISVIYQHLEKAPTPPRDINADIPAGVEYVVMRALQKRADDRFATAGEMADELAIALGRRSSTSSYPAVRTRTDSQPFSVVHRRSRRWLPIAAGVSVVALVAALIVGVLVVRGGRSGDRPRGVVVAGERGNLDDTTPTTDEIEGARAALGDDGFISYVACTLATPYHAAQAREISDIARAYDLPLRVYDGDNNPATQIAQIERARIEGASAMLICPLQPSVLRDTLTSIRNAGLPLVLMAANMPSYGGVLISGDEYLMGLEAGRAAGRIIRSELNGRANVVVLDYPEMPALVTRANGLVDGVREQTSGARVIGNYLGALSENGQASIARLIEDEVDFDVILSINDSGAYGAIEALEAAEIPPDQVVISSIDAEPLARDFIARGYYLRASVQIDRLAFSQAGINSVVRLVGGGTMPELILVPPGPVITAANVEEANATLAPENAE